AHLIKSPRIAVLVLVVLGRLKTVTRLLENVSLHRLHARVLLREEDVAGLRVDCYLTKMRQLGVRSADEPLRRSVAVRQSVEHEETDFVAISFAACRDDHVADGVYVEPDDVEKAGFLTADHAFRRDIPVGGPVEDNDRARAGIGGQGLFCFRVGWGGGGCARGGYASRYGHRP